MPLPFPLWWIAAGLAGTATVGGLTKTWRKPYLGEREAESPFPPSTSSNAISRARDFLTHIKDFGVLSKRATSPADLNALAEQAYAQKKAEKEEAIKQTDKLIDDYKRTGTSALLYTGVGVVAIPFIWAGAELLKAAGRFQVWLVTTLGLSADGWTEFWRNDAKAHSEWYIAMGIPFPEFKQKFFHTSPMGYVKSTLYPLHLEIDTLGAPSSPNYQAIKRMGESFKRHSSDNPAVLALYSIVGESGYGLANLSFVPEKDLDRLVAGDLSVYHVDPSLMPATDRKFTDLDMATMFTAAVATSVGQDYDVPFEKWDELWKITIRGFGLGLKSEYNKGHLVDAVFGMMNARLEAEWHAMNKLGGRKPLIATLPFFTGAGP